MRIAVLMTNTDESDFSNAWPKDGEKFPAMMARVRSDWEYVVYSVKDGVFPDSLEGLDGVLITGSPASVNSGASWVERLLELIRDIYAADIPMFGACFGHQAIAMAFGGTVGKNPEGWVHGLVEARYSDGKQYALYASHSEQVTKLPQGAQPVAEGPGCDVAGFMIGNGVMTTQYHPEMEPEFIAALTDYIGDELGDDIAARAHASFSKGPDMEAFAERIALFIERKSA